MDGLYRRRSPRRHVRTIRAGADFHHPQGGPGRAAGRTVPGPGRWELRSACPRQLGTVLVSGLAQVHSQIETKAVQVISNAAGEANLHAPHGRGIESHPAVEAVFAGQAGTATDGRQVKAVFALAAAALPFAHDLAEDLLVAEREYLIA